MEIIDGLRLFVGFAAGYVIVVGALMVIIVVFSSRRL